MAGRCLHGCRRSRERGLPGTISPINLRCFSLSVLFTSVVSGGGARGKSGDQVRAVSRARMEGCWTYSFGRARKALRPRFCSWFWRSTSRPPENVIIESLSFGRSSDVNILVKKNEKQDLSYSPRSICLNLSHSSRNISVSKYQKLKNDMIHVDYNKSFLNGISIVNYFHILVRYYES